MSLQQERQPPPAYEYTQHEPETLNLPAVPTHAPAQSNGHLPGIRSLNLPEAASSPRSHNSYVEVSPKTRIDPSSQWGTLPAPNGLSYARALEAIPRTSADVEMGSPMDTTSVVSTQDDVARRRETSIASIDDPDVRIAAEALSGLGNPDFARSPTSRSLTIPRSPSALSNADPEPLLSLITSNHPWLGGTINHSISAYNTTKTYSPRFVKYGAELIERNIGSPAVNVVSSVGRRTGVESGLRRYLGEVHRRPSDLEQGDGGREGKRMRVSSPTDDEMDIDDSAMSQSSRTRGASQSSHVSAESLPAYDLDSRSPKYEETSTAVVVIDPVTGKPVEDRVQAGSSREVERRQVNWSTQLIMTTSGLGVALSDASLRSLRACLCLLRGATSHIDNVMRALSQLLAEFETAIHNRQSTASSASSDPHSGKDKMDIVLTNGSNGSNGTVTRTEEEEKEEQVARLASRMKALSSDIWATLQNVVQAVSRYTGGALPQNAAQVVRTQLLSVPQRWQIASRSSNSSGDGDAETRDAERSGGPGGGSAADPAEARAAKRMLAFAREGLDMMGQITTVVDGTVRSAEGWLGRIGKRPREEAEGGQSQHGRDEKGFLIEVDKR